jgi:hypothetical protein
MKNFSYFFVIPFPGSNKPFDLIFSHKIIPSDYTPEEFFANRFLTSEEVGQLMGGN